jgi:hypothetical protein
MPACLNMAELLSGSIVIEMVATHDATKHTNGAAWHGMEWNGMDMHMLSRPECGHVDGSMPPTECGASKRRCQWHGSPTRAVTLI